MTAASPALHQAAVHPHEPAPFPPAFAGRSVLRRRPCRAFGVASPMVGSSLTLRADLAGSARTFGSLFHRNRSCRQAVSGRVSVFVRGASLQALHRQHLRCGRVQSTTGLMAWASSNAGQIIQEIGA